MSQLREQYIVRMPNGMRDRIKEEAERNQRSMNAEIIYQLNRAYSGGETQKGSVTA